jgi:transposase-like protein
MESIAPKIGCVPKTLIDWVRQHEVDEDSNPLRAGYRHVKTEKQYWVGSTL